jgi:23S rRNA (guanosine2251-2'-O)-methyltransferase
MDLKNLWERANEVARSFQMDTPQSKKFQDLLIEFQRLQYHNEPSLQKIGRLAVIFEGHWSHRQWLNLLVPLERYLDRRLTDVELIGATPDGLQTEHYKLPLYVIADHWRSAFNVGALFRLSDGFGVTKIYLTGYTPTPEQPAVQKTAMGSIGHTPWEHRESTTELIQELKQQAMSVWALETSARAVDLGACELPAPMVIVLGNERFGLDPKVLELCDGVLRIPLRGVKNSMNVANCFGIFAYEWCRQHATLDNSGKLAAASSYDRPAKESPR